MCVYIHELFLRTKNLEDRQKFTLKLNRIFHEQIFKDGQVVCSKTRYFEDNIFKVL